MNSNEKVNKMEAEIIQVFIDEIKQILSERQNTLMECTSGIDRITPSRANVLYMNQKCTHFTLGH